MDCILRPLINEYKETFGQKLEKIAGFYSDIFHQTSVTKEAKAETALIGSHQQYLNEVKASHDAARIKNFLCNYKKIASYKGYHDDIPSPQHHTCSCFCSSNILAYKL